ncbi:hypothetical protein PYCC9005_005870 [Savitreella phatthalungensis]
MASAANLALDGADPRLKYSEAGSDEKHFSEKTGSAEDAVQRVIKPQERALHDKGVSYEEYAFYAEQTRAEQDAQAEAASRSRKMGFLQVLFPAQKGTQEEEAAAQSGRDLFSKYDFSKASQRAAVTDEEWANASRAMRNATQAAVFYLITTDILGPFGLPYAFGTLGYGPGAALFTVFGIVAGYSGYLIWMCFMGLDSFQFPVKSFGDLGYRLGGAPLRHFFNFLQAIQLILNVGLITISNGEALSQSANFKLCYIICCLVWAIIGFFIGQIRTLQKFGFIATAAVYINVAIMAISIAGAAKNGPLYSTYATAAGSTFDNGATVTPVNGVYPTKTTTGGLPTTDFGASVNGAAQAIFAFGGSLIFPEFASEMRRPRDFLKAMWGAQIFITAVYLAYGLALYSLQGGYVQNPSYLGIPGQGFQTAGNVLAMISAIIAAALYGNIGLKTVYNSILVDVFRAPSLQTQRGKIFWAGLIPLFWAIAFVIAAGIPAFSGLTGVVAAFCIATFTYSAPPAMAILYMVRRDSVLPGEGFDPNTGVTTRHDSGLKRIMRGFFSRKWWWLNTINLIICLAAVAMQGLAAYGSITVLRDAFDAGAANAFTCTSPLDSGA